jgi:hypothetical protein
MSAIDLLGPAQIDTQAANNKVKHGLAVRARSVCGVTFVDQRPNDDGSMPLSAFTADGATDILISRSLSHSLKDRGAGGHRQGLELTQIHLKMSAILEEAFMFASNVLLRRRHPRGP